MAIAGSKEGIKRSNKVGKKIEPLMSVEKLKANYLYGITIEDEAGNELPDSTYQQYIDNAVSMLEHDLDISITPVIGTIEDRDYQMNEYVDWGYFKLHNLPVISITTLEMVYFRDADGEPETIQTIPGNWIRLQNHDGIFRLIPNAKFPANLQIGQTGNYFPEVLRASRVPHLWRITYDHGFEDGCIPVLVNHAIGLLASIQALIVGGNLVIGAGIAAEQISIDGLAQSIQTTQSAENSAYSATIKEYQALLVGKSKEDHQNSIMKKLRDFYQGSNFAIL